MWQDKSSVAWCRRYLLIFSETTWINKSCSDSFLNSHVSPMQTEQRRADSQITVRKCSFCPNKVSWGEPLCTSQCHNEATTEQSSPHIFMYLMLLMLGMFSMDADVLVWVCGQPHKHVLPGTILQSIYAGSQADSSSTGPGPEVEEKTVPISS